MFVTSLSWQLAVFDFFVVAVGAVGWVSSSDDDDDVYCVGLLPLCFVFDFFVVAVGWVSSSLFLVAQVHEHTRALCFKHRVSVRHARTHVHIQTLINPKYTESSAWSIAREIDRENHRRRAWGEHTSSDASFPRPPSLRALGVAPPG